MKIVSLLPSATEIVYALGLEDSLHGVTFECDHPVDAATKPVISRPSLRLAGATPGSIDSLVASTISEDRSLYRLDEQRIRQIQPDLILAQDLCRVCAVPSGQVTDALDKLGCMAEVISLDPNTVNDVLEGIECVARAAVVEKRGREVVGRLRERVEAVRAATTGLERIRTLFLEWPDPPFVGGHWAPEMVAIAGGGDVLGDAGHPSRRVDWDEIAASAPEVVVYSPCGYGLHEAVAQMPDVFDIPQFAGTPAALAGNVYAVDASSYFSRPGPRIVDGIEILAWALHHEEFAQPLPESIARVAR